MALITIRESEFKDAASDLGKVVDRIEDYRKALDDKILEKINDYADSNSENMSNAASDIREKRRQLDTMADDMRNLQKNANALRDHIITAERNLTDRIEQIVNEYCDKYGLDSEKDFWTQLFEAITPDWLEEFFKDISAWVAERFRDLKNWYRFEGGREIMNAVIKGLFAALAVIGLIAATLFTGGTIWAVIAGVAGIIGAAIALVDSIIQLGYALEAADAASRNDPVWARRYETHSNNEGMTSSMRRLGQFKLANVIDVVDIVCSAIDIIDSAVKIGKTLHKFRNLDMNKGKGLWEQGKNFFATFKSNLKFNWEQITSCKEMRKLYFAKDLKTKLGTVSTGLKALSLVLNHSFDFFNGDWNFFEAGKEVLSEGLSFITKLGSEPLTNESINQILDNFESTFPRQEGESDAMYLSRNALLLTILQISQQSIDTNCKIDFDWGDLEKITVDTYELFTEDMYEFATKRMGITIPEIKIPMITVPILGPTLVPSLVV